MNLFKVLASSKKRFPEEQASVLIAWLLNPYMEHGLGFTFLKKFLTKIDPDSKITTESSKILQPILRSERISDSLRFSSDIEFNVNGAFIDIIIFINDFIISIENKIYSESAKKDQLILQYEGLKRKYDKEYKITIVFLVPDDMHKLIREEYDALQPKDNDTKKIITWDMICEIIQEILDEEQKCQISPISEYLRHTLKSFSTFIKDNFSGYYYETTKNYGNMNPLAKGRKTYEEIRQDASIKFVGVNYGVIGLLSLEKENIEKDTFQYATKNIDSYKWLKKDLFIQLCGYIKANKYDSLSWLDDINSPLPSILIYNIAKNTSDAFYIGIKGGDKVLLEMEKGVIVKKQWFVSLEKRNSQWIGKEEFIRIMENKNVFANL